MTEYPEQENDEPSQASPDATAQKQKGGYQAKPLITLMGLSGRLKQLKKEQVPKPAQEPDPAPEPEQPVAIPETPAEQKQMLWKGQAPEVPRASSRDLVREAAESLNLDTPDKR